MFEKEAEEYVPNINWHAYSSKEIREEMMLCYRKGAEFGYNKANEWHNLRKNPEDLPETRHSVYAKLDSGTYIFAYCVNGIWYGNDDGIILYHGNGKSEVIAWCEIPRYTEEV